MSDSVKTEELVNDIAAEVQDLQNATEKKRKPVDKLVEHLQSESVDKKKRKLTLGERKVAPGSYINFILLSERSNKSYRRGHLVSYKAEDFPLSPDDITDALRSSFLPREELQPSDQKNVANMEKLKVLINNKKWDEKEFRPSAVDDWALMDEDPGPTFCLHMKTMTSLKAKEFDSEKEAVKELDATQELVDN